MTVYFSSLRGGEADAAIHCPVLDRHAATRLAMTIFTVVIAAPVAAIHASEDPRSKPGQARG
jgi:hypothetical protein